MKSRFAVCIIALASFSLVSLPYTHAQAPGDPLATADAAARDAQAAQWRANQARATAQAAYGQATAQAQEATRQAELWATAQAQQATAQAAQVTAQAAATRQALEVEATRVALRAQETRAAIDATRQTAANQATATYTATLAEQDRAALASARLLYTWGPWALLLALAILVGLAAYAVRRDTSHCTAPPDPIIEWLNWNDVAPATEPVRCLLRPIIRQEET